MQLSTRLFMRLPAITALAVLLGTGAHAQSDVFMRDTAFDTGIEPYTGPGLIYDSPDIWVRRQPDPNYDPYPFTGIPTWTPLAHENPEYRNTKTGQPNYVYVRIHNRGSVASSGTDRLRLYQAKASTGLSWPASWVDNMDTSCGASLLHGIEITKPRRDASAVSVAERIAYRDAVVAIATNPAHQYSDGVQYFTKQNIVHTSGPEHGNPAFPPWHREMVNQYENLLREANPLLTLLYWDFTENPLTGVNLFTNDFMGPSTGTVTGTLGDALPVAISRSVAPWPGGCTFDTDAALLGSAFSDYAALRQRIEVFPRNHDCAHGFLGGAAGDMSFQSRAARDPVFFLLHANVDRHWATWQRNGADPSRVDPVSAYGTVSSNTRINAQMTPWNGGTSTPPWTGSAVSVKTSKHPSVTFPPVYDTAPLNIPVLQPGESVVIEIPWFPPDVNNFNCQGQAGHFCLLARIETQVNAPFGMTVPEVMSVASNTVNNNNIAWKNLEIVDSVVEPLSLILAGTTVHNIFDREAFFGVRLVDSTVKRRFLLHEFADLGLAVPDDIFERIMREPKLLHDLEIGEISGFDRKILRITGKEPGFRLPMKAGERFTVELVVRLRDEKPVPELLEEPFLFDIEQVLDLPPEMFGKRDARLFEIGGVRWELDIARILLGADDGKRAERMAEFGLDRIDRLRQLQPVELRLDLKAEQRSEMRSLDSQAEDVPHLSPGEPLQVVVEQTEGARAMRRMSLEVDGQERASTEGGRLAETLTFDKPGVYTIATAGLAADGTVERRHVRVLVSENIPPLAAILSPEPMQNIPLGVTIAVVAEIAPAWQRKIDEVALLVMEGDRFGSPMEPVDVREFDGRGTVELTFKPERSGHYMAQVSARDDLGNTGVSGSVMFMVTE